MNESTSDDGNAGRRQHATGVPRRRFFLIVFAVGVFWAVYLSLFGPRPGAPKLEGSGGESRASYSWTLRDLKDRPISFEQFRGKTVFLNIWATWCPPCIREMPSIARLAEEPRLKGKPIAFVCVATDESSADLRAFLEGRSWSMSFFRAEDVPGPFYSQGIPVTFILAPDGRIAAAHEGGADWDSPEVIALLEKLSSQAPASP
ncbi:MAG: TlpA family protein disulfide reductase [Isosphaeraceae bacterium]